MRYNILFIFNNTKSIQYIFDAVIKLSEKHNIYYYLNHQMCMISYNWNSLFISEQNDIRVKLIKQLDKNNCKCIGSKGDGISYEDKFKDTIKFIEKLNEDEKYLLAVRKKDKDQVVESGGSANQLRREYFKNKSKKFTSVAKNQ